ncbi:uncharacterized protein maml2 [Stigmatopora argus]
MGEATPAQSAAGAFAPMLAVGMGSAAAHGAPSAATRGSSMPQLHSAIVERLRARIELCRRHHSTCEDRYRRGQAESSDREHESTLHLLNVVQQGPGPGTRKGKSGRGAAAQPHPHPQPPPDYGVRGTNGEQRGAEGDHKMSTRIALQGSLRRKLEGHAPKQNSLSCAFSGSDFKRVRLEVGNGGAGLGLCDGALRHAPQSQPPRKTFAMPDVFTATLKEMKKEPTELQSSCGRSHADATYDFKDEGGGHIDPDLQDLFDELTKSVPPLDDLDFEKMLKQEDGFCLDLGRPIKLERSPDYAGVQGAPPQLRPPSAGPSFALTASPAAGSLPCWPEISHAEQLKQMAANQHQPGSLLHHHHHHHRQAPADGPPGWGSPTFQDKGARPRIPQQGRGANSCIFNSNGVHRVEMKPLSAKPALHFSPKAPPSSGHVLPLMTGNKSDNHRLRLSPHDGQNQNNPRLPPTHFHHLQHAPSSSTLLHAGALRYKMSQHHQGGPRPAVNANLGEARPLVAVHQPTAPVKSPVLQRQLNQAHGVGNTSDKDSSQDEFSRHLTRLPPDYRRSVFPGANPTRSSISEKELPSACCLLSASNEPGSSDRRFEPTGRFPDPSRTASMPDETGFPGPDVRGNPLAHWPGRRAHAPETRYPPRPPGPPKRATTGDGGANQLTFDFLPEGDNTVPGINADSDFIDSLLKAGSGNDDWMKDINLDEILGSHG